MRGNVPDLDLPTPAEMRDTDGVDLTDLNHTLTDINTHTHLRVTVICCCLQKLIHTGRINS